ncbi:hypothetical protein [Capnocytophaga sp.]|uniref:hypothetical protein n=1 Tax=Capnocytophaga sp. TaxID=44737 RepID=UPI0026DB957A|nr:hypothetical protein [Capnocytophaga sp.]MDO5104666.1 hypothetical protein [Capnocytophaga sp.]
MILTTSESHRNCPTGYSVYALNENFCMFSGDKGTHIFIPDVDFEYVKNEFQTFYPRVNPLFDELETQIDPTSDNVFDRETCRAIIEKIQQKLFENESITKFAQDLVHWLNQRLEYAPYINFYGNL